MNGSGYNGWKVKREQVKALRRTVATTPMQGVARDNGVPATSCGMAHMRSASYSRGMEGTVALLTALAEPTRLAALRILWDGGEHCVCELMKKIAVSQSRMSRHMSTLKAIGLVTDRRDAQWVRYRLSSALSASDRTIIAAVMATVPERQRSTA